MNIHAMTGVAEREETCGYCHHPPGAACTCAPGVHLCRIALAAHHGHITMADAASAMHDMDVFTGASVVLDGAL